MGFMALGVFTLTFQGMTGSAVAMVSHGLIISALFILVAAVERATGSRRIGELAGAFGGLSPTAVTLTFFSLAALGLPGLSAFIGEFLVAAGVFRWSLAAGALTVAGVALGALYWLRMLGRVVWAPAPGTPAAGGLAKAELAALAVLGCLVVALGLFPGRLIALLAPGLRAILAVLGGT